MLLPQKLWANSKNICIAVPGSFYQQSWITYNTVCSSQEMYIVFDSK